MHQSRTLSVGLDVHQDSMAVADVDQEHQAEVISLGAIGTRPCDLDQRIRTRQSNSSQLGCVYDAGPWGSWLSRDRTKQGHGCGGVAPSLIPTKAGARVQTTRRAASQLARLMRAGDLPPVDGPQVEADASRALRRAREEAWRDLKTAQPRLNALLLRHDIRYTGQATWGPAPRRWLREVVWPTPAPPIVYHADVRAVPAHRAGLERLEQARQDPVHTGRLGPVVDALQARRGVQCTVAGTSMATRGDRTRFDKPSPRMRDLGLTPSDDPTGAPRRQGALTKTGHAHARRARLDGAWAYRSPAHGSRHLPWRLNRRPKAVQDLRWKAQVRLCQRARRLSARGHHAHRVVVAIARELSALMWAMAQQVPVTPEPPRRSPRDLERPTVWTIPGQWRHPGVVPPAALARGRHPTDPSQGVANPRRSAGSPVGSDGLRRFRWTAFSKGHR